MEHTEQQVPRGNLWVISAASGTGKTSLVAELLNQVPNIAVSTSHTTRSPRPGEEGGVHYHFVSQDAFLAMVRRGEFLEHAQVFDNFYGTSKAEVESRLARGQDVVLEIDWQGAEQIRAEFSGVKSIFILPPSKEALRERLTGRGQDSEEVIERRLAGSLREMQQFVHFDYLVVNDCFTTALEELKSIVTAARLVTSLQSTRHIQLIVNLLDAVDLS